MRATLERSLETARENIDVALVPAWVARSPPTEGCSWLHHIADALRRLLLRDAGDIGIRDR